MKGEIKSLENGQSCIIGESDYGSAEIWRINDIYILFEIPQFGGGPVLSNIYSIANINKMISEIKGWT